MRAIMNACKSRAVTRDLEKWTNSSVLQYLITDSLELLIGCFEIFVLLDRKRRSDVKERADVLPLDLCGFDSRLITSCGYYGVFFVIPANKCF